MRAIAADASSRRTACAGMRNYALISIVPAGDLMLGRAVGLAAVPGQASGGVAAQAVDARRPIWRPGRSAPARWTKLAGRLADGVSRPRRWSHPSAQSARRPCPDCKRGGGGLEAERLTTT